jgi:hypothetical protein
MDVTSHDNDQVKQQREYRLIHQQKVFEQRVLICKGNEVIPISEELPLETRKRIFTYIYKCLIIQRKLHTWNGIAKQATRQSARAKLHIK